MSVLYLEGPRPWLTYQESVLADCLSQVQENILGQHCRVGLAWRSQHGQILDSEFPVSRDGDYVERAGRRQGVACVSLAGSG